MKASHEILPLVAAFLLMAGAANACPVCFDPQNEANRVAFIATTVFLTFLPLLMIGGIVLWLRRRFRVAAADAVSQAHPAPLVS